MIPVVVRLIEEGAVFLIITEGKDVPVRMGEQGKDRVADRVLRREIKRDAAGVVDPVNDRMDAGQVFRFLREGAQPLRDVFFRQDGFFNDPVFISEIGVIPFRDLRIEAFQIREDPAHRVLLKPRDPGLRGPDCAADVLRKGHMVSQRVLQLILEVSGYE